MPERATRFRNLEEFLAHLGGKTVSYAQQLCREELRSLDWLKELLPHEREDLYPNKLDYSRQLLWFGTCVEHPTVFGELGIPLTTKSQILTVVHALQWDLAEPPEFPQT